MSNEAYFVPQQGYFIVKDKQAADVLAVALQATNAWAVYFKDAYHV